MGRPSVINIGDVFGQLTVVELIPVNETGKHIKVKVVCACGVEKIVQSSNLKKSKSCGCRKYDSTFIKKRDPNTYHRLEDPTEAAFNMLYVSQYKGRARKRGYPFELDKTYFKYLTKQPCYYCGIAPHRICRSGKSEYVYNGIDRIDNDKGYIEVNVRTACFTCNQAKHSMTTEEFEVWIDRLSLHKLSRDQDIAYILGKESAYVSLGIVYHDHP